MSKIKFVNFEKEQKIRNFKENVKLKCEHAVEFIERNKELVIAVTPVIVGGVATLGKVAYKRHNQKKEQNLKDLYCYDRSLGHYWRLKRELSNKEWVDVERRKRSGERLADILSELRVLK